jgi:hypothetical protein
MPRSLSKQDIEYWLQQTTWLCLWSSDVPGKEENTVEHNSEERVILDLWMESEGKNCHIYFDKYFTSTAPGLKIWISWNSFPWNNKIQQKHDRSAWSFGKARVKCKD